MRRARWLIKDLTRMHDARCLAIGGEEEISLDDITEDETRMLVCPGLRAGLNRDFGERRIESRERRGQRLPLKRPRAWTGLWCAGGARLETSHRIIPR